MNNNKYSLFFILLIFFLSACAPMRLSRFESQGEIAEIRSRVVYDAESLIGRRYLNPRGKHFPNDCSGFIASVYYKNNINLIEQEEQKRQNLVKIIFDNVSSKGIVFRDLNPKPGDIVFFSNTHKKFGENTLSHIGLVEKVDEDGTITFIHKGSMGIVRDYLNLKIPSKTSDENEKTLNSYLRRKRNSDPPATKYLAGELFEAYGNIIDPKSQEKREKVIVPEPVVKNPDEEAPIEEVPTEEAPVVEEK